MRKYSLTGLALISLLVMSGFFSNFTSAATTSECFTLTSDLHYSSSGSAVSALQTFLYSQGYLHVAPTGYLGSLTKEAVMGFQSANGISPTGYVGALTRQKIVAISCGKTPLTSSSSETSTLISTPTSIQSDSTSSPHPIISTASPIAPQQSTCQNNCDLFISLAPGAPTDTIHLNSNLSPALKLYFTTGNNPVTIDCIGGSLSGLNALPNIKDITVTEVDIGGFEAPFLVGTEITNIDASGSFAGVAVSLNPGVHVALPKNQGCFTFPSSVGETSPLELVPHTTTEVTVSIYTTAPITQTGTVALQINSPEDLQLENNPSISPIFPIVGNTITFGP